MPGPFSVFTRNRDFRRLFFAQLVMFGGDWFVMISPAGERDRGGPVQDRQGALGMVQNALEWLRDDDVVELEERKAQMLSNLLVVLCGDRAAQPVVNAGTLYP